jgi:hypothetical protein
VSVTLYIHTHIHIHVDVHIYIYIYMYIHKSKKTKDMFLSVPSLTTHTLQNANEAIHNLRLVRESPLRQAQNRVWSV